jgi:hypothetical protein
MIRFDGILHHYCTPTNGISSILVGIYLGTNLLLPRLSSKNLLILVVERVIKVSLEDIEDFWEFVYDLDHSVLIVFIYVLFMS